MDLWILQAREQGIILTGAVLRAKWKSFADRAGIPSNEQLSLSEGWLARLKNRHDLRDIKRHGEAGSVNKKTGKKARLTYALTCNADGSDKLPPMVIGKYKKPRPFNGKTGAQLGFQYYNNAKAWMTGSLYKIYIEKWDAELRAKGRKILLLQDNFSGHTVPEGLTSIRVENFEPNLTSHVQPNDQGIIHCFKAHYRAKYIERAINHYDSGTTPSSIYDIDILEGMRLADAAWREVDVTTIRHCWRRAGILPVFAPGPPLPTPTIPVASLLHSPEVEDPISRAESTVTRALDELVKRGALQPSNRMDIGSLLNPEAELEVIAEVSEEEIFDAVREAAQEDNDEELEEDSEEGPSRREALQAVALLTRYAGTVNDPAARKLEDALAGFSRQLRHETQSAMVNTSITEYFRRQ
ncbi:DDE-domain-containing protein [Lentinus tigrinus ALCF2SS1-6]|uniref:DDE-domain-containing protein n=1 Tax=Lentinus tigrinus ALCF2SS1-6 TaxID=1328759 RepID=A0A5C2SBH1_9APHY|nr:DDE-domain-containing protein [Lentinus tigrinus ALCF2SS1-6]